MIHAVMLMTDKTPVLVKQIGKLIILCLCCHLLGFVTATLKKIFYYPEQSWARQLMVFKIVSLKL